ncbi:MAG TPA: TetR/AcrR family transcriptional regulator [Gemmatimonadaceae bacterium]|jgi:AcrR family transcriptional regulator|nr:TetR/AcrR family transcriptional regulator [Gemmatimonadaceae bacterium]
MATAARERAEPVATRERILFAALDAFAHAGYRGATTRVIARAAGVTEITLFRLFGSKAELFEELVRRIDELLVTPTTLPKVPRDPHAELLAWLYDFAGRFERIAPVVRVAVAEHESHPKLTEAALTQGRRALRDVTAYLARLKSAGLIDATADTAVAARLLVGAVYAWATAHSLVPETSDEERSRVVSGFCAITLAGLGLRASSRPVGVATVSPSVISPGRRRNQPS